MKVADKNPLPVDASTPKFRNLSFSGIIATGAKAAAGFFYGLPESPIESVSLSNISVTMAKEAEPAEPAMMEGMAPMAKKGILIGNTRDFSFDKVRVFDCDGDEISEII